MEIIEVKKSLQANIQKNLINEHLAVYRIVDKEEAIGKSLYEKNYLDYTFNAHANKKNLEISDSRR